MNAAAYAEEVRRLAAQGAEAVTALVDLTLRAAADAGASDIHLEPAAEAVAVRVRLDGVLQDFGALPRDLADNLVARCKVLAGLLSYRSDIPQEGGVPAAASVIGADLRISTFPTLHGERVAIRIFDADERCRNLETLGLPAEVEGALRRTLARAEGLVLLAGPAGSGKTTTLYAALRHVRAASGGGRSIVSVEDPIENELPGVTQTAVRPAVDLTFARSLRSLLRQDPEVIMVGEVRDAETAHIVTEAALTGHLVLSTVHAGRVALVPHRLLDMGVEPYALAGALSLVIAERLLRKLCSDCRRPATDGERAGLSETARAGAHEAVGCSACHKTGFRGRVLVAEKLSASDALHDAIMEKASRARFARIADTEGADLEARAWELVAEGCTTAGEVRRAFAGGRS